jgi:general secretion pathway protein A
MYLDFFGLHRHPFRITPEDDFIYMSQQHSRAYVYMSSAIWSSEGFVVISGEIGSGKTTLLKKTIRNLEGNLKLLNVSYTNLESKDLFGLILRKAGMAIPDDSKVAMLFQITEYLERMASDGTPVVLAIDEAQNLTRENLEDIRMLTGMESMGGPSMRVILLGQPELKKAVNDIPQLSQRVKLFFHLEGLSAAETS